MFDLLVSTAFVALVGEELDLSVVLPFSDYLPETVPVRVLLRVRTQ